MSKMSNRECRIENVENVEQTSAGLHRNLKFYSTIKLFFNMFLRKVLLRKEFLWKNQKSPVMNKLPLSQLLGLLESAEDEPERDCIRKAILRQRSITLAAPSSSSAAAPSTDMVVAPTASDSSLPVAQHDISMAKTNKNKGELVVDGYGCKKKYLNYWVEYQKTYLNYWVEYQKKYLNYWVEYQKKYLNYWLWASWYSSQ